MRIIKIWYLRAQPAVYQPTYDPGYVLHNQYGDYYDLYLYSADDAMQTLRKYAEDYKKTWEKYGENRVYPVDVCCMFALLVPVLDDVPLPDNADELFRSETRYLDGVDHENIVPEYDFPWGCTCYTLFEDGEIIEGDGRTYDPHGYLPRWKAAGWSGVIEEVTDL